MSDKFVPDVDAFRFYEDGTESGSSPVADQDTNVTGRDVSSDNQIHLRYRMQETGSGTIDGETTDDYILQWRKNGGGGWLNVTGATLNVRVDTGSALTDGAATTDRSTNGISAGTGSFVAGEQEDGDGEITDYQLTGDNYTEHVWALLLVSADLLDADFLEFRVSLNGGSPGMDNSVVPRVTVSKISAADDEEWAGTLGQGQQEPIREKNEIVSY